MVFIDQPHALMCSAKNINCSTQKIFLDNAI